MRSFGQFVLIGVLAAISLPRVSAPTAQAPARDAAAVLAEAREALGGEKRLAAVKNFVVTGRTRQIRGDNLVPIEFEIAVELPDKYVRKDEIPAQESGPTSTGFSGDELIQLPVPATPTPPPGMGRAAGPATPPTPAQLDAARKARVATVKQDFVRLTLGMFAGSFSSDPLTFTYVGQAEAPQGKADVVEAKGAPNFTVRLFVNSQTHLPIMVSWQAPGRPAGPPRGSAPPSVPPGATAGQPPSGPPGASAGQPPSGPPGASAGQPPSGAPAPSAPGRGTPTPLPPGAQPPGAGAPAAGVPPPLPTPVAPAGQPPSPPPGASASQGGAGRSGAPAALIEYRIYFADYRDVDGLQWPFRLRRATGSETTEETTFDRFKINTKIDPKKFEVRK
jgi:hypothetical protein